MISVQAALAVGSLALCTCASAPTTGDFDGDGRDELLLRNAYTRACIYYDLDDGGGAVHILSLPPATTSASSASATSTVTATTASSCATWTPAPGSTTRWAPRLGRAAAARAHPEPEFRAARHRRPTRSHTPVRRRPSSSYRWNRHPPTCRPPGAPASRCRSRRFTTDALPAPQSSPAG